MGALAKRDRLANWSARVGLTRCLESLPGRNCLIVLNYHRIGNPDACPFDSQVFSASAGSFERQVSYVKKRFRVLGLDEALEFVTAPPKSRGACVHITFDDGYLDNYEIAFPILRAQGVPGTFFLPTSYIGSSKIPWWDSIAFLVKHTSRQRLRIEYPEAREFDLARENRQGVCQALLGLYKSPATTDRARFLAALEDRCEVSPPEGTARLFLNWTEAAEMVSGGMAIGAHSHSHEVLARLSPEAQFEEVKHSADILKERLGVKADVCAYPVGTRDAFDNTTVAALRRAGYRAAFSYYGGINLPGAQTPFNILRTYTEGGEFSRFRLQSSVAALTARYWI